MMVSGNLGAREYARIFGVASLCQAMGTASGPLPATLAFDRMGDYRIAFICLLALYALAAPAALPVRKMYTIPAETPQADDIKGGCSWHRNVQTAP